MKFKVRPSEGATCADGSRTDAPFRFEIPVQRGCRVTLCPDFEDFEDELYAEVVDANNDTIRVRALHDFYLRGTERILKFGDEFQVTRAQVFASRAMAGLAWIALVGNPLHA